MVSLFHLLIHRNLAWPVTIIRKELIHSHPHSLSFKKNTNKQNLGSILLPRYAVRGFYCRFHFFMIVGNYFFIKLLSNLSQQAGLKYLEDHVKTTKCQPIL